MKHSTKYYVYKIVNIVDNSVYIGITNDIARRKREHFSNSHNKYLNAAIKVFGEKCFEFSILQETTREEVDSIERNLIQKYKDLGATLYNVSKGGLIGNGAPGTEHWNHRLTEQDITNIRKLYASNKCTQRQLADIFNTGYKNISKIIRGQRWKDIEGPITTSVQPISKVANRRKLSDTQVLEVRYEAQEEYGITGTLHIPEIAELYGVSRGSMRMILKGISYPEIPGPLLGVDYYKDFGNGR